jgi:hypothetical protein
LGSKFDSSWATAARSESGTPDLFDAYSNAVRKRAGSGQRMLGVVFPVTFGLAAAIAAIRPLARVTLFCPSLGALARACVAIASARAKEKSRDRRRLTGKILTLLSGAHRPPFRESRAGGRNPGVRRLDAGRHGKDVGKVNEAEREPAHANPVRLALDLGERSPELSGAG